MRLLFLCVILIVGQVCTSIFIMTPNYTREQIVVEHQSVQSAFGKKLAARVAQRATTWLGYFKFKSTNDNSLSTLPIVRKNKLENMRANAYRYPENYQYGLYQILLRFALLSYWFPVLLSIFLIFILEGLSLRHKGKFKFTYSKVERNRLAFRFLALLIIIASVLSFSVMAIPALTLLILDMVLAISVMFVIASSKRSL